LAVNILVRPLESFQVSFLPVSISLHFLEILGHSLELILGLLCLVFLSSGGSSQLLIQIFLPITKQLDVLLCLLKLVPQLLLLDLILEG
jgi:hypothetical protein